jgi:hypothetical protein
MQVVLKLIWILGVAVAGLFPSAASADPILVIDATADPGVGLLVTFVPQSSVVGGVRRVAAQQSVVTKAVLRLGATLPTYWMVSVWRKGDVAANVATRSVSDGAGYMNFVFPNEMDVILDNGEWQIPHFDSNLYLVAVGFGIGDAVIYPAYAVNCRPGQQIKMAPGNYQMVRSDGDDALGTTIKPDLETWDIPSTSDSILTFNAKGEGTLGPLH